MKKKIKKRKFRFGLSIILSILFAIVLSGILNKRPLKTDVQLIVELRTDRDGIFELFTNNKIQRKSVDRGDNTLKFRLSKIQIKQLRLKFGIENALISIKKIRIQSFLKKLEWKGAGLEKLITFVNQIKNLPGDQKGYNMTTTGKESYLVFSKKIPLIINKLSQRKLCSWIFGVCLVFLFFLIIHNLGLDTIKILWVQKKQLVYITLFLIFLSLPIINEIFHFFKGSPITDKRIREKLPKLRFDPMINFFNRYQRYYKDHFFYRSSAIHYNNFLKISLFKQSPLKKVILGKENWLFFAQEKKRNIIDYYRNIHPYSQGELDIWIKRIQERKKWLNNRGIKYLFVVVPNKSNVYSDKMPAYLNKVRKESKLGQLKSYIRDKTRIDFIDLTETLLKGKTKYPVFDRTDSHWNDYGAFLAYTDILSKLKIYFPSITIPSLDSYPINILNERGGDLATMLSLEVNFFREDKIRLKNKNNPEIKYTPLKNFRGFIRKTESYNPKAQLSTAVVVHDSFMHQLKPFLSSTFQKVVYIWDWDLNFFPDIIKNEQPVVVIEEMTERVLIDLVLQNPSELSTNNPFNSYEN